MPKPADNGLLMKPVDAPPPTAPRRTLYAEVVQKLAEEPGQWFHVRQCATSQSAQSARQAIAKWGQRMNVKCSVTANGVDVYARAEPQRGRRRQTA